jgi:molecular chaperone GrpE
MMREAEEKSMSERTEKPIRGRGGNAAADRTKAEAGAETASGGKAEEAESKAYNEATEAEAETAEDREVSEAETGSADAQEADAKYMRLAADFQNYRKRTEKERFERYTEGKKDLAADILPVLDNFERAVTGEARQDEAVAEGLEMILKQLSDVLAKNGVAEIEALGADFDPNLHHAVAMEASGEHESGKVCDVLQKGYAIGDKIIRPAMVKVAQ